MSIERATIFALAALDEVGHETSRAPVRSSIALRALLAFLVGVADKKRDAKRCADEFWRHATGRANYAANGEKQRSYMRGTETRSALSGLIIAVGYEPSVPFLHGLARHHMEVKPDPRPGGMPAWGPRYRGDRGGSQPRD